MKGAIKLNKQLEKKIERLELLKSKEMDKIKAINEVISDFDKQLKVLYDYKRQQEKIYSMQQDLDAKILEHGNDKKS